MRAFLLLISLFLGTPLATGAPGAHGPDGEHLEMSSQRTSSYGRQGDGSVTVSMSMQSSLGIRTQIAIKAMAQQTVSLPGFVRAHPRGYGVVQPLNDGFFKAPDTGVALTGTQVMSGDVLGYIRYLDTNFDRTSQEAELVEVTNAIAQTERDVNRLKGLGELASKQSVEQLDTHLQTLKEQREALTQGVSKTFTLVAPLSGVVVNHVPAEGTRVSAGDILFEIIDDGARQIEALSADPHLSPRVVGASLKEAPESAITFTGTSPTLTQGMATLYFDQTSTTPDEPSLPINTPVVVLVELDSEVEGIILPASAVVKNRMNLATVWIKASAERFLSQQVDYLQLTPTQVLIVDGLGADNRVVVSGTSLLNQIR